MNIPANYKFSKTHEWVAVEGKTAKVGLSEHAAKSLGDLVFVNLPELNTKVACGKAFADVESVKAVSDVFSPLCGTVVAVNECLLENPELINQSPYDAWLIEVAIDGLDDELVDAATYGKELSK